jgi:hypothetical protein
MATYAYDQIDQARAELNAVSKQTTYERLNTLSRIWLGDISDIAGQR